MTLSCEVLLEKNWELVEDELGEGELSRATFCIFTQNSVLLHFMSQVRM